MYFFLEITQDVITVAENGAHGDGTTRMFAENLKRMLDDWSGGLLADCPNAREDALNLEVFRRTDRHAAWRAMDPRDPGQMTGLAQELGIDPAAEEGAMQGVMRLFYGVARNLSRSGGRHAGRIPWRRSASRGPGLPPECAALCRRVPRLPAYRQRSDAGGAGGIGG